MIILVLAGCAARVGVGGAIDDAGPGPHDYAGTFNQWTQSASLHDGMKTVLLAKATLLGPELAVAMAAERRAWVLGEEPAPSNGAPWTVAFSAASDEDDLDIANADAPAAWQVGLLVDGRRCILDDVTETELTAVTRRLYPNLSVWDRQWVARFSGCSELGEVQLQLTGAHGALEFGWSVGGDSVVAMRRAPVRPTRAPAAAVR
ncbi:MAG: hypothetical protein EXR69_07410 [Myxococcales bacterium]|nr:hypothetical protein [Myxococcales bacterium]